METTEETITIVIIGTIGITIGIIEDGEIEMTLLIEEEAAEQDILLDQGIVTIEVMHEAAVVTAVVVAASEMHETTIAAVATAATTIPKQRNQIIPLLVTDPREIRQWQATQSCRGME